MQEEVEKSISNCSTQNPTILVPGIKGAQLINLHDLEFEGDSRFFCSTNTDPSHAPFVQGGQPLEAFQDNHGERCAGHDQVYGKTISVLESHLQSKVFIFRYDSRRSSEENGRGLKSFVSHLKETISAQRFHFITHGIGGLVFSCFLRELGGCYEIIDRAVLTACPFLGSVSAMMGLLECSEGGRRTTITRLHKSGKDNRKSLPTFPSLYELLPVYPNAVSSTSPSRAFDIFNSEYWPTGMASLASFKAGISKLRAFRDDKEPVMLPLSRLPSEVKARFLVVAGEGEETRCNVMAHSTGPDGRARNFFDFEQEPGNGDGTVPLESSAIYRDEVLTLAVNSRSRNQASHVYFLSDDRVLSIICRFLTAEAVAARWWSKMGTTVRVVGVRMQ